MIILETLPQITELLKSGDAQHFKLVCILDRYYIVSMAHLVMSEEFRKLERIPFDITKDLLDSFPPPRQNLAFVTPELLAKNPVIMFETPGADNVYFRFDGRHRILGAHRLGRKRVQAKFVPRSIWGRYLLGFKPTLFEKDAFPLSIKRPTYLEPGEEEFHYEPNFVIHDLDALHEQRQNMERRRLYTSNAGVTTLFESKPYSVSNS